MGHKHGEDFKREAVRLALSSGLTRKQVAADLGIGLSTLGKWIATYRTEERPDLPSADLLKEVEQLRRENRTLKEERDILKKANGLLRQPEVKRFAFIETWKKAWPIEQMCRVLQVTSRGFRAWRSRTMSRRQREDLVILAHIREQHRLALGSYGRPRMTEELKELGLIVGHRRVGRLMKQNNIRAHRTRKHKATTDSNHRFNVAPNLLDRDFSASGPNQKWAGDISYIWTREGWLYLAVILDLYSRRVIGWAASNRMKKDLAIRALDMAINLRQPPPGCLHHTDRGSQYCSHDYQKILRKQGFQVSMSGKGICYDNSVVETFFKSLKAELIWRQTWTTRREAEAALFQYINGFYNPRRRHSALGWKSPLAFERNAA
ncbi:MAG: IS3 family transposase [Parvularcula sp.]|nr:IS3 family transposase [Parvularcula sp.]